MSEQPQDFDAIGLDEIVQLSQVDNDHAPEVREQALAALDLYRRVDSAITEIGKARENISVLEWQAVGEAFAGESGDATRMTVLEMSAVTGLAHEAMESQPGVFAELANRVEATHSHVSRLRTERNQWLALLAENPQDPALKREFAGVLDWAPGTDAATLEREIRAHYD
ncbi:MAG: hypothetical protein ACRD0P_23730, partial [Stackebrandtia sp.]